MKALSTVICAFGAAFGLAVSASAGNVTLTWDASADPLPATLGDASTGLLEFTYDPGDASLVSNITARPVDGGTIVLKGDQINVCSRTHIIMAAGGELVFSNAVNGVANIDCESTADSSERTLSYSGANFDTEYRTIFANKNLSDWMPYETGNAGGKGWWKTDGIKTYNIRHETDGSLTAQRQADLGSGLMGIVKFQLKQNGANIDGRVIYAGYWDKNKGPVGTDSDDVIANPVKYGKFTNQGVSTSTKNSGYGINKMTMYRVKGLPTVRFAGGLDIVQVLYAREFTHVIYERAVTGSAQMGYQADANGILTFRDPEYLFDPSSNAARTGKASDHGIKGAGTIEFEATDALYGDETYDSFTLSHAPWIPTSWVTVATNQLLRNLLDVTAIFGGASIGGDYRTRVPVQLLDIADDGQTATAQFHQLGSYNTGVTNRICAVLVELRQNGDDVQMMATGAAYTTSGYLDLYGKDMSGYKGNGGVGITVNNTLGSYGVHDLSLKFRSSYDVKYVTMGYYPGIRNMVGSTAVPGCKAQLIVKGTNNTRMRYNPSTANSHALPYTDGLLRVLNGGELVQQRPNRNESNQQVLSTLSIWVDDRALIRIEDGGVYKQQAAWGIGVSQRVDVANGEFRAYDVSSAPAGQIVANLLTFSGGTYFHSVQGRSGDLLRAGYSQDAIWTVRGTSSSTLDMPLQIWGMKETAAGGNTVTFAVNDVTGTSASDFIMNGAITRNVSEPDVLGVYKTGPGTMQLNASYNVGTTPTLLMGGTWLLNGSSLTAATSPYTIDGGTLAVADGTANSLGVLTVGAAGGGITLGAGATLTFADSSAATWTGDGKVFVTGFAENSIKFTGGLSDAQRTRLRMNDGTGNGKALYINAQGYLTRIVGTRLIIR